MIKLNEDIKNLACATYNIIKPTHKWGLFKVCCLEGILYRKDFECGVCEEFGCTKYRLYREVMMCE